MSTDELLKRQRTLLDEWPLGTVVWHRACGRQGVLMGIYVLIDGEVGFRVDYGAGGWSSEKAASLRTTKPRDDDEEWKDGEQTSEA